MLRHLARADRMRQCDQIPHIHLILSRLVGYQRRREFWRVLLDTDVDCHNGVHCGQLRGNVPATREGQTHGRTLHARGRRRHPGQDVAQIGMGSMWIKAMIAQHHHAIDVRLHQEYLVCGMSPILEGKFMKTLHGIAAAVLLGLGISAWANPQLAEEKQCMQCHAIAKDGAGPAFQKIALLWKGNKDAENTLVSTIRKGSVDGGGRHWGVSKMPDDSERPLVSEDEARQLVKWILSL